MFSLTQTECKNQTFYNFKMEWFLSEMSPMHTKHNYILVKNVIDKISPHFLFYLLYALSFMLHMRDTCHGALITTPFLWHTNDLDKMFYSITAHSWSQWQITVLFTLIFFYLSPSNPMQIIHSFIHSPQLSATASTQLNQRWKQNVFFSVWNVLNTMLLVWSCLFILFTFKSPSLPEPS